MTFVHKILFMLAVMCGQVSAQDVPTMRTQILSYQRGFNYLGLQALGEVKGTADVASVTGVTVLVENMGNGFGDGAFIFEISGGEGDGIVTTATVVGNTVVTDDDLSSGIDASSEVTLREIQTLASVFGATNRANLTSGGSFGTSDQIWLSDGAGEFAKYAYLIENPFTQEPARWEDSDGNVINPESVALIYTDGIIINAMSANDVTLTGYVKTGRTSFAVTGGFNYLSTVYPVGWTLGESNLEQSFVSRWLGGGASDQLWIPKGVGGFDKYAYLRGDPFTGTSDRWVNDRGVQVDPDEVTITSSGMMILVVGGPPRNVILEAPNFNNSL